MLRRILLAAASVAAFAALPASAHASFECRGTAARIDVAGTPQELFTAGGSGPCQADSSALTTGDAPGAGLDANVLRADTAPPASASARASGVHLAAVSLNADEVNAQASARCDNGQPVLEGSANASGLSVAGVDVDDDDVTQTVQDPASGLPVGAIVHVVSGEEVRSSDTLIERGAHITVTAPDGTLIADIVLAEARVAAADAPCAAAAGAGPRVILDPADGHTLVASATPSDGATIATCSFTLDGAPLAGTYDPSTRECRADATGAAPGAHPVTVSVADSAGQTGSDSGNVTFSLLDPTAQLLDRDGRTLSALATAPGSTIASCVIGVRSGTELAYTALATTYAAPRCTADLAAADYPPGEYDLRAVATNAEGATATDTRHISIAGPAVNVTQPGATAHPGDDVAATVTPADGTSLAGCSVTIDTASGTRTPAASMVDGQCRGKIPEDIVPGPAVVTVAATDSAGETGRGSRDVVIAPLASTGRPGDGSVPNAPARPLGDAYLACGTRSVALVDVTLSGSRVKLLGAARSALIGKKVELRKVGAKTVVARATVGKDGMFSATAKAPRVKGKIQRTARYQAKIGSASSVSLKLTRELRFTTVKSAGGKLTVAGVATGRYGKRGMQVVLRRRVSCSKEVVAGTAKVAKGGKFRATVQLPAGTDPALYRATIKVKRASTFTLPRAVSP